ncbi:MAG: hypothetical protein QF492_04205 [Candidatus Krumholzibacteria bacterium]|jgi:DNA-directed RNA polymerase subunit K/omega|nr:hypothetical protein [Candidatus Krumholzibacteria bacterium]MDP6669099.1 hypothetical protein [Candidatus Krumholzibacteria bacterium]MDP6797831.1 hypothetical protein [Candidatus Krumholzibacteria bacterium]MDP7022509.1 hypothetical protein [Candidatus Krumholzibacteria bacterium]
MGFIPTEKLTNVITNKYEAILVVAKEARVRNSIAQLKEWDPEVDRPKITSLAISRLLSGDVEHYYPDPDAEVSEEPAEEESEAEESDE